MAVDVRVDPSYMATALTSSAEYFRHDSTRWSFDGEMDLPWAWMDIRCSGPATGYAIKLTSLVITESEVDTYVVDHVTCKRTITGEIRFGAAHGAPEKVVYVSKTEDEYPVELADMYAGVPLETRSSGVATCRLEKHGEIGQETESWDIEGTYSLVETRSDYVVHMRGTTRGYLLFDFRLAKLVNPNSGSPEGVDMELIESSRPTESIDRRTEGRFQFVTFKFAGYAGERMSAKFGMIKSAVFDGGPYGKWRYLPYGYMRGSSLTKKGRILAVNDVNMGRGEAKYEYWSVFREALGKPVVIDEGQVVRFEGKHEHDMIVVDL